MLAMLASSSMLVIDAIEVMLAAEDERDNTCDIRSMCGENMVDNADDDGNDDGGWREGTHTNRRAQGSEFYAGGICSTRHISRSVDQRAPRFPRALPLGHVMTRPRVAFYRGLRTHESSKRSYGFET